MTEPTPTGQRKRLRRTRLARERRDKPDRLFGGILLLTILFGVALVGFLAFFGLTMNVAP